MNSRGLSDWVTHWGQFLTHDMTLIRTSAESNRLSTGAVGDFNIRVTDPTDPLSPGPIPFDRSVFDPASGDGSIEDTSEGPQFVPRWQINSNTSYIDASNVYGSDAVTATSLRTMSRGKLITSAAGLLPGTDADGVFLAGDERINENLGLTAIHALFVREHNRLADLIATHDATLTDEQIYQRARRIVGAEMQAITYNEFLPAVIGDAAPRPDDFVYDADKCLHHYRLFNGGISLWSQHAVPDTRASKPGWLRCRGSGVGGSVDESEPPESASATCKPASQGHGEPVGTRKTTRKSWTKFATCWWARPVPLSH